MCSWKGEYYFRIWIIKSPRARAHLGVIIRFLWETTPFRCGKNNGLLSPSLMASLARRWKVSGAGSWNDSNPVAISSLKSMLTSRIFRSRDPRWLRITSWGSWMKKNEDVMAEHKGGEGSELLKRGWGKKCVAPGLLLIFHFLVQIKFIQWEKKKKTWKFKLQSWLNY